MAEGNPIRRLLQIVLDRAAAKQAADGAKAELEKVEKKANQTELALRKLGQVLLAAFGIRALTRFGFAAVAAAEEVQKVWGKLRGTVEATGEDFEKLEPTVRALGDAFQDATVHDAEDFAASLDRMITLSGDVQASIANMGLAANVASQFFGGDLAPAVELVSKVMNGNINILARMGIQVKSAQEGLDVLAQRSFGAAERQAATFAGQIAQLTNAWGDFKEELGAAVVENDQAVNAIGVLKGIVETLTQTVKDNAGELRGGFSKALEQTVEIVDGVYRGVRGVVEIIGGAFFLALGTVLAPIVLFNKGVALMAEGAAKVSKFFGLQGAAGALDSFAKRVEDFNALLQSPTSVGLEMLQEGASRFTERTQTAEDVLAGIRNPSKIKKPASKALGGRPVVGKNAKADELSESGKALDAFSKAMKSADTNAKLLGPSFDLLGAKASALETVLKALGEEGWDASNPKMMAFASQLRDIQTAIVDADFEKKLQGISLSASLLGRDFDATAATADALEDHIRELIESGIDPLDPKIRGLEERFKSLRQSAKVENAFKDYEDALKSLGIEHVIAGERFDEFGKKIDPITLSMEALESEAEVLQGLLQQLAEAGLDQSDPAFAAYLARLKELQGAMQQTASGAKAMADAAELAGDIVGAAMGNGIVPFAKAKARQNLIEAAEEGVRAIISAFTPFGQGAAAAHAAAAVKFTAIAGAWAALAKSGIGGSPASGGGGGGGAAASSAATAARSASAKPAETEVHIHLVGPGFNALNPEVQKIVFGAQQQARERFGENATIRLHRDRA